MHAPVNSNSPYLVFASTLSCPQATFRRPAMERVFGCALFLLFILFADYSSSASLKPTNSSQDCPTTQQGEGCTLGLTKEQPAASCYHIFTCNPQGHSGMYWIRNGSTAGEGAHQFFCELEEEHCGLRGLMRVVHINTSEPCSACPPPLAQYWANGIKGLWTCRQWKL